MLTERAALESNASRTSGCTCSSRAIERQPPEVRVAFGAAAAADTFSPKELACGDLRLRYRITHQITRGRD